MFESLSSLFLRWMSRRSLRSLHASGSVIGWLTYWLSPSYRRRLGEHATLAGLAPAAWRPAIASAGEMVMELPYLWLRDAATPISRSVTWRGAELVDAALDEAAARQRGIVFLTPHLGAFEVIAQAYAERYGARSPFTVLYRPSRQRALRKLVDQSRARPGLATAPASLAGVRQMMRALRRGEAVGLLPDQVPPDGMGVWAPYFGKPAYTMTLAARLAQQTGARIVLMRCERLPRGQGFMIEATNMVESFPEGVASDEAHQVECAAVINREMERLVLRSPGQYLWAYNRYKSPREPASPLDL